jgi:hypothetical protein
VNRRLLLILCAFLLVESSRATPATADDAAQVPPYPPVLLDNMDDAAPALRLVDQAAGVRLVEQSMLTGRGATDQAAERVLLTVPPGLSGHLAYDLPAAHVIDDFQLSAWVMCNQPGTRLAATVVLPRTIDPETGAPRRMLVRSDVLAGAGGWERITLDNLFVAVARQARVLRARQVGEIDERGAQVTQLVILAPGGTGVIELWVDQIAMYGVLVQPSALDVKPPLFDGPSPGDSPGKSGIVAINPALTTEPIEPPRCPRIIQWQGESFQLLQEIGFDGIWMAREPNDGELAEATRLGLALISPPPAAAVAAGRIDPKYGSIMAWDLGELATSNDVVSVSSQAEQLLKCDGNAGRPTLLQPRGMTREASSVADAILVHRPTAGAEISWPWYAIWLGQQRRAVRPGTPLWVGIETHYGAGRRVQLAALRNGAAGVTPLPLAHLTQATTTGLTAQPAAMVFKSQASLAAPDENSRMRRLALGLTNLRLGMMQPWLAECKSAVAAKSNREDLSALVLKFERSHLIVPLRWDAASAASPAARRNATAAQAPTTFVLPGVPESTDAYLLSTAGYDRLPTRRVTGGLEVSVEQLPDDAMVLLTEDGIAFSHVERYLRDHGPQASRARVELAALRRQQAARAVSQLPADTERATAARSVLHQVDSLLAAVIQTIHRQEYAAAFTRAAQSEALLDELESTVWAAIDGGLAAAAHPLPPHWSTVADGLQVAAALAGERSPPQWIPAGEFENLDDFVGAWERHVAPTGENASSTRATIRLSAEAPHQGAYCLELATPLASDGVLPAVAAGPQAWVTSPPLAVPPGHLLEITGWVRVPEPLGTVDPLIIFDSIGGEDSALRFDAAPSWTPFRMVRAVPPGAECRLTIALGAIGRAQVDSLQYRLITLRGATDVPPVRTVEQAALAGNRDGTSIATPVAR